MATPVIPVIIKGILPTPNGCAVFLGNEAKTFVIYVDHFVGNAMRAALEGSHKERPLTHDLIGHILTGVGAQIDRIVINEVKASTFFARILLRMENELGRKLIEIDARPSDCIVLAIQHQQPLFVAQSVFDSVEDSSDILERIQQQAAAEDDDEADEGDGLDEGTEEEEEEEEGEDGPND